MKIRSSPSSCAVLLAALIALPMTTTTTAQTAVAPVRAQLVEAAPAKPARPDLAVQRIRTEDAGTRIDEVRVGGETQSITVQPKTGNNTPAYDVKPSDSAKGHAPSPSNGNTNGSRVWNVLKF